LAVRTLSVAVGAALFAISVYIFFVYEVGGGEQYQFFIR
jgi:hypothetical protein